MVGKPHCDISVSVCGAAFTWIRFSAICVSEPCAKSTIRTGDISYCCIEITHPKHFGRPVVTFFTPIDESLFGVFEDSDIQTCMQSDKFREIASDPLNNADDHSRLELSESSRLPQSYNVLVNFHKAEYSWEVRWLTLIATKATRYPHDFELNTSADGSLVILQFGPRPIPNVLDFNF